jgi:pimeloyl-ACP methyl ester carboxylesterase
MQQLGFYFSSCNLNPIRNEMNQRSATLGRIDRVQQMQFGRKEGVTLGYKDTGRGSPPMLFLHGCGCDHTHFAREAEFFSCSHGIVSVDLHGHGSSDVPHQNYRTAVFAGDLAWLCSELGLTKPIVVGHSIRPS